MKILSALLLTAGLAFNNTNIKQNRQQTQKEVIMTHQTATGRNKTIVQKLFTECFNKGNFELLHELIGENFTDDLDNKGASGFSNTIKMLRHAFPDIHYTIASLVAEGDQVAVSWKWTGTNKASFRDYPASGKTVTNHGMAVFNLLDGKIVKAELETDRLGFLQSIGVVPQDLRSLQQPAHQ